MDAAGYLLSSAWYDGLADLWVREGGALAEKLFDLVSNLLRADEIMLFHFREAQRPEIIVHRTRDPDRHKSIAEYRNGFYLLDPFYLSLERGASSGAYSLSDVIEDDAFHDSEYYIHHYLQTLLADEFCYCITDGSGGYLLLSFARSTSTGRFHEVDLSSARVIAPVVLIALSNSWRWIADPKTFEPPSPEEVKLHRGLRSARNNFGRSVLTAREFEVVQLMLRGYSMILIAERLDMAEGTTKVHRRSIYRKLDIGSQAELFSLFIDVVGEVKFESETDPLVGYGNP
jgi:DNA-binding CsgD family transcriptional regulator